ncbi:multisubunit sodium/proton antiporter MrpD subunit [Haloactinopolyspora alba]|uniref:Multisubunit sodium/proton antiporter MrpD subunit n=1 Tax=Haloactinopolyspora alba TaxID=648780 RepID=A0A2P8E2G8_9ACTN|nr:Na+/H+ antiporter subunit D [Haloactinopolyspora alba]PSL03679.1 multisubunit sodium/proton antiporter MrpD subunit [Haloactinopolyspora alba]
MNASALVPLPVILPLLGAGLAFAFGRSARAQRVVSVVVLSVIVAVAAVLLTRADAHGPQVMHLGGWHAPIGIALVADRVSALMLLVSAVVALCVLVYSLGQGVTEYGPDTPLSVFHPTFLVLIAGVSNAFLSGDLFNIYVGFEVLLAASYVLLTLGGTSGRIRAGTIYVIVSLVSSVIFLTAIALIYAATGTVNLAHLSVRLEDVPDGIRLALQLMLMTGFAVKAAVFPLWAWLPDSYPTAPAPVTAVFAGLLTKVGIYAIIRTQTLLFPGSEISGLLMWAALLTMLIGVLGAVAQTDVKRMLSFTLVSHIGYMVFGVALSGDDGLSAAMFYVVHHITIQTTLFLVVGLIERRGGSTALDRLGGLARSSPVLAVLFFVPAMNLAGIPPFPGFLGKVALMQAGVENASPMAYVLIAGAVTTSLLTLYAMAKAWNRAFWQPRPAEADGWHRDAEDGAADSTGAAGAAGPATDLHRGPVSVAEPEAAEPSRPLQLAMTGPAAALVLVGITLSVVAGPLFDLTDRAAVDLRERAPYVEAVLPQGGGP